MSSSTARRARCTGESGHVQLGLPRGGPLRGRRLSGDGDRMLDLRRVDRFGPDVDVSLPGAPAPHPERRGTDVEQPLHHVLRAPARSRRPHCSSGGGKANGAVPAPRSPSSSSRASARGCGRRRGSCGSLRPSPGGGRAPDGVGAAGPRPRATATAATPAATPAVAATATGPISRPQSWIAPLCRTAGTGRTGPASITSISLSPSSSAIWSS